MIDQRRAEAANEWLVDNAGKLGEAKALANLASNSLRRVKAMVMVASEAKSAAMREAIAYASPEYKQALDEEFEAVKNYETLKAAKESAIATIDLWRSINSSLKGVR